MSFTESRCVAPGMHTRRLVLAVAVALTALLAGCAGLGDAGNDAQPEVEPTAEFAGDDAAATETAAFESREQRLGASTDNDDARTTLAAEQRLIRTGTVRLTVDEYGPADEAVRETLTSYDGFVAEASRETRERDDEEYTVGELVVRVPSDDFDAAMSEFEAIGEVEQVSTESEDVGEAIADLEARLENREAERDRLRDLYEDANTTEDVLAVQSELADVQAEIERLDARLATLEERVALSTIRVGLTEQPSESGPDELEAWYDIGVSAAFLESVSGVGTALRAAVVAVAYATPYVATVAVPLTVVGVVIARRVDPPSFG